MCGYGVGIRSSRKLERALHEDVGFRILSGNQQPDYWTLSEFRRRHPTALRGLSLRTVRLAQRASLRFLSGGFLIERPGIGGALSINASWSVPAMLMSQTGGPAVNAGQTYSVTCRHPVIRSSRRWPTQTSPRSGPAMGPGHSHYLRSTDTESITKSAS